jgi:hypothetical protein
MPLLCNHTTALPVAVSIDTIAFCWSESHLARFSAVFHCDKHRRIVSPTDSRVASSTEPRFDRCSIGRCCESTDKEYIGCIRWHYVVVIRAILAQHDTVSKCTEPSSNQSANQLPPHIPSSSTMQNDDAERAMNKRLAYAATTGLHGSTRWSVPIFSACTFASRA